MPLAAKVTLPANVGYGNRPGYLVHTLLLTVTKLCVLIYGKEHLGSTIQTFTI